MKYGDRLRTDLHVLNICCSEDKCVLNTRSFGSKEIKKKSTNIPDSVYCACSCAVIIHPVIFRQEHLSILREAFLAMYRYVNVCKCKLISKEHFRQILISSFTAVSLGKTNTCIWLNIGRKLEKYEQACTVFLAYIVFKQETENERNKS